MNRKRCQDSSKRPNEMKKSKTESSNAEPSTETQIQVRPRAAPVQDEIDMNFAREVMKVVMPKTDLRFANISGHDEAKRALTENIVLPSIRSDLFVGLRKSSKGILLFGPPGTGKTSLALAAANESSATFFNVSAANLISKQRGYCEKMMKALFDVARVKQPSIIFIDEADALLSSRFKDGEESRRLKNEFLTQLDGNSDARCSNVVVIAATNRPQEFDEAVLSRFRCKIFVTLPDFNERICILKNLLSIHPNSLRDIDIEFIARMTDGYSGRDLRFLAEDAAMASIKELSVDQAKKVDVKCIRQITLGDVSESMKNIKRSVSAETLKQFDEFINKSSGQFLNYYN